MKDFDPNSAAAEDSGIFGLPFSEDEATIVYVPVPWEATTSYGGGTSGGPAAILKASHQVDLFDLEVLKPYEAGLFMREESSEVLAWNKTAKKHRSLEEVNSLGARLNDYVLKETRSILDTNKIPAIVGGDHSTPFGAFQAMAEKHPSFGILHFDAHSDTREAYEGFQWSHASIMNNALVRIPQIKKLVQVGIRDFCEEEMNFCKSQGDRVKIFFDTALAQKTFQGQSWDKITQEIVRELPEKIWVSFDIDGLDPRFCPHTGTPVPGGLDFQQANYIIGAAVKAGKKIIGFDLNEVAPHPNGEDEWDANVGARLLYKMSAWTLVSQGKAKLNSN